MAVLDVFGKGVRLQADLKMIADHFRAWVCGEIARMPIEVRTDFRGDFLFVIDGRPRFVVFIDRNRPSSAYVTDAGTLLDEGLGQPEVTPSQREALLSGAAARAVVSTDPETLKRLLLGTMKARAAYLSGAVSVQGDLPCFLRLVTHLKRRGVTGGVAPGSRGRDANNGPGGQEGSESDEAAMTCCGAGMRPALLPKWCSAAEEAES